MYIKVRYVRKMNEIRNKKLRRVFDYVSEKLILLMKIGDIDRRSSFIRFATLYTLCDVHISFQY